jgi:PilZ domain
MRAPNDLGMEADDFTLREVTNRRIATRYVVSIPIALRIGDRRLQARIVDISDSGAKIECPPLEARANEGLQIELPWFENDRRRASMLARFVRRASNGCGVQFADPDPFLRLFVKLARLHDDSVPESLVLLSSRF